MLEQISMSALIAATFSKFSRFILVVCLMGSANAFATIIDSIDIVRVGNQAEVLIRFATEIQYIRHVPDDEGKFLRIFFRVTKPGFPKAK